LKHTCAAVFIVFLLFFSISFALSTGQLKKITSSDFLIKTFNESGLYTNLPGIVAESFKNKPGTSTDSIAFQVISQAVEPQYLKTQVDTNLPLFIDYLNGRKKTLDVKLDLKPFKAAMLNQTPAEIQKTITDALKAMPVCSSTQDPNDPNTNCRPTNLDPTSAASAMASTFQTNPFLSQVPDSYTFQQSIPNPNAYFSNAKRSFRVLNITFLITSILTLILIGILSLMGKSDWPSIFRWTGFAFILPSGLQLIVVVIGKASLNPLISACVAKASPTMANLLKPVIAVFANNIFNIIMLYAGIAFFVGLVMIVLSYIFHSHKETKNVQQLPR
jgi:hypothetical protein